MKLGSNWSELPTPCNAKCRLSQAIATISRKTTSFSSAMFSSATRNVIVSSSTQVVHTLAIRTHQTCKSSRWYPWTTSTRCPMKKQTSRHTARMLHSSWLTRQRRRIWWKRADPISRSTTLFKTKPSGLAGKCTCELKRLTRMWAARTRAMERTCRSTRKISLWQLFDANTSPLWWSATKIF